MNSETSPLSVITKKPKIVITGTSKNHQIRGIISNIEIIKQF